MNDNDRSCGCHTIYLIRRGGGINSDALLKARLTPGAFLPYDNEGDITPMIFHTCGHSSARYLVVKDDKVAEAVV